MNSKIAMSGLSILASFAIMGGATFAYFSNAGTSSANTFATGSLDLKLTDASETDQDNVSASFGSGTLAPGSCTGNQTLSLKNTGSVAGDHAEVKVTNVITDSNNDANPDMDAFLRLNLLTYDGVDQTPQITDFNGNGYKDLDDWETGTGLDNLALVDLNTNHPLVMDVCLNATAGNEIQGDSVDASFAIDLNQHVSQ